MTAAELAVGHGEITSGPPVGVAIVSHSAMAGSEQAIARLVASLRPDRYRATVVLPEEGPLRERLEARGVASVLMPSAWWVPATHWTPATFAAQVDGLLGRADRLAAWLSANRIALVHTNTLVTLEGALAAAAIGIPHLFHSRGLFDSGFPPHYFSDLDFIFGVIDRLADGLICVSRAVRAQAERHCWLAPLFVVHDGFDRVGFLGSATVPRERLLVLLDLPPGSRIVASLGGLQRRKGQIDLVDAFALLADRHPELHLVLAGGHNDEEYVRMLQARIAQHGLAGRIHLPGNLSEPLSLLQAAAVVVQPSLSEGFGLGVLEAAAAGRPVVATRCGGPEEILEDERSGLLVPPADPGALAHAIGSLLDDAELARRLGEGAAQRAIFFDSRATADAISQIYEATLSSHRQAGLRLVDDRRRLARSLAQEALARVDVARRATWPVTPDGSAPPPPGRSAPVSSWRAGLRALWRRFRP